MAKRKGDWRAGLSSQAEQQLYMLESGTLSDCTFTVGYDGITEEFHLHRVILSRCSEVFEAMLLPSGGRMLEAQTGQVTITDIQPGIFHTALKLIYSGDDSCVRVLPLEEALGVSGVADKYRIFPLQTACEQRLCSLLHPDCVWRLLGLCETLQGYCKLKEKCVQVLRADTLRCLRSPDLGQASEASLVLLLSQDELDVQSELPLITAAVRWARVQAAGRGESMRAVLEPRLLPQLRLLSLSQEQLGAVCGLAEWLSESERDALVALNTSALPQCFSRSSKKRVVPGRLTDAVCPVNGRDLKKLRWIERRASWESKREKNSFSQDMSHVILLETSRTVWLTGLYLGPVHYCNRLFQRVEVEELQIRVFHCEVQKGREDVLMCNTTQFTCALRRGGLQIKGFLPEAYKLESDKMYGVQVSALWEPEAGAYHVYKHKLLDVVKWKSEDHTLPDGCFKITDQEFKFNRRGTVFDSIIKGVDILEGLCYVPCH